MREHTFRYVECTIPAGMTAREHLLLLQEERSAHRVPARRRLRRLSRQLLRG
jgi:hypothetical protein